MTGKYAAALLDGKPLGCRIIDCHGHLDTFAAQSIPFRGSAESMVAMMDSLGVQTVCLSHHMAISADFREGNRLACAAASRHPGRFAVYLAFNPTYPPEMNLRNLALHAGERGIIGVKLHTTQHQTAATDSRFCPAYEFARDSGKIILSHTWGIPDIKGIEQMAKKYPEVPIIMGHSGGYEFAAMYEAIRVARENANAYLDITLSGMFEGVVETFVREAGVEKVLFGSDIPFMDPRANLGRVIFARISDSDKEKVLGRNMEAILSYGGFR